jgi:hypothetical protein
MFAPAPKLWEGVDFSSASGDFKLCSFVILAGVAHGQPRARVPYLVVSRLPRHYRFRARIQSYQAVAAPFPGDSVLPRPLEPRSRRNASAQKIVDRLATWDSFPIWEFQSFAGHEPVRLSRTANGAQDFARRPPKLFAKPFQI